MAAESQAPCSGGSVAVNGQIVKQWGISQKECAEDITERRKKVKAALEDDHKLYTLLIESCEKQRGNLEEFKRCVDLAARLKP